MSADELETAEAAEAKVASGSTRKLELTPSIFVFESILFLTKGLWYVPEEPIRRAGFH